MPHTLLLRLPAPGQEDTEWLSIDEAGAPSDGEAARTVEFGRGRGALGQGRRARAGHADPARRAGTASRQRSQAGAGSALRPRRAAHRRYRSVVFCARAAPSRRPHSGRRGIAQRTARLDFAAERRRHRADGAVRGHLFDPGKSGANGAMAGEIAPRRAPPRNLPFAVELTPVAEALVVAGVIPDPLEESAAAEGPGERHSVRDSR